MLPSEYLTTAADILSKPNGWCQGTSNRDIDGKPISHGEEGIVSQCLDGAIYGLALARHRNGLVANVVEQISEYKAAIEYLEDAIRAYTTVETNGKKTYKTLVEFNDENGQTQDNIVQFLRSIAAQAAAAGK